MKPYTICKFRVSPPLFFFFKVGLCVMFSQKSTSIFGTITLSAYREILEEESEPKLS